MATDLAPSFSERLTLRSVLPEADEEFLRKLYRESRNDLEGVLQDENRQRQLIDIQYRGQTLTYAREFPNAAHSVIQLDGRRIGRVMVDRQPGFIHLVDLSLVRECRSLGIGTFVLKGLLAECAINGVPCLLRVLKTNKARDLYERLGFRVEGDDGTRFLMRWDDPTETDQPVER